MPLQRGGGGRRAVTVYFKNSGHATVGHATVVEPEPVPAGDASAAGNDGIVLKDSDGNVIGGSSSPRSWGTSSTRRRDDRASTEATITKPRLARPTRSGSRVGANSRPGATT